MHEKILVVDDDPETIGVFKLLLNSQGYQVVTARDGIEALQMAHREKPDLIILDIMLPGADGFEVARSLNRTPDTAPIPILMVTARNTLADRNRGYDSGADVYLTKPVAQRDLQANIKLLLGQRKAHKDALAARGYVVGVLAARGGCGVSTLALNLAISSSKRYGKKAIAAELRPGLGVWSDELSLPPGPGMAELLHLDLNQITPPSVEQALAPVTDLVRVLPAAHYDDQPLAGGGHAQYQAVIEGLSSMADLVVLDIGAYFSALLSTILARCNELIIVFEPKPLPVLQTTHLIETLRLTGGLTAKPLTLVSLNRSSSDVTLAVSQIEELVKRPVALGIPPAEELSVMALRRCLPMVVAQPQHLFSQQIERLAELVQTHRESI
jgi:CheY-like chemotaxis protein